MCWLNCDCVNDEAVNDAGKLTSVAIGTECGALLEFETRLVEQATTINSANTIAAPTRLLVKERRVQAALFVRRINSVANIQGAFLRLVIFVTLIIRRANNPGSRRFHVLAHLIGCANFDICWFALARETR